MKAGKPVKQAVAIAYAEKREAQKAKAKKWQTKNAQLVDQLSMTLLSASG
jgi:ABC-type lipoprotein release transport system permease subunit